MVLNSSTMSDATKPPQHAEVGDEATAPKQPVDASSTINNLASLRWNRSAAQSNAQRLPRRPAKSPAVASAAETGGASAEKKAGKAIAVDAADADADADAGIQKSPRAADDDGEEVTSKMWNLRPRKPGRYTRSSGLEIKPHGSNRSEGTRHRTSIDAKMAAETKEKMRFSLSLTKEEIEEDFLLMTGAKPSRRPTRRNKQVQKEIDNLYPGSWLEAPLPDMYKTSDNTRKD